MIGSGLLKWTSINEIISQFISDTSSQKQLRTTTIVDWICRSMEWMKVTPLVENKVIELDVEDFQANLPCDIIRVDQVAIGGRALVPSLATGHNNYKDAPDKIPKSQNTYSVDYPKLNLSFKKGKVMLYYSAIRLDEEGFPLIPDDEYFKQACIYYVESKLKYAEYHSGKISFNDWKIIDMEFRKMSDKFRARATMINPEEMQSLGNQWQRMIPDLVSQTNLYKNDSNFRREYNSFNGGIL